MDRRVKLERKKAAAKKTRVLSIYPALAGAEEWLRNYHDPIPMKQYLDIPD